jgi:DNA (cytosine-5)-methyltransferase 1
MGYHRAGFDVVGVDIKWQPHYPFSFVQGDALNLPIDLSRFDAIHASPPCQFASPLRHMWNSKHHDDLIGATRDLVRVSGLPYVIENVPMAARLGSLRPWLRLCGSQFGLGTGDAELRRHRYFETNFPIMSPPCTHGARPLAVTVVGHAGGMRTRQKRVIGVYGGHGRDRRRRTSAQDFSTAERREAMGIDWMTGEELSQAVPPAYTEFIGRALLDIVERIA